jgi:hypothetical protein
VPASRKLRLEFLGGEIVCTRCSAVLHINHTTAWAILGQPEVLLVAGVLFATAAAVLHWWSILLAIGVFVTVGVTVAWLSPFKVVEATESGFSKHA